MQQFAHARVDLAFGGSADAEAEGHVLEHCHVTEQRVMLKHEADVAVAGRAMRHVFVVIEHAAAIGAFQAGNDA